jgi:hypothetical protein
MVLTMVGSEDGFILVFYLIGVMGGRGWMEF